MPHVSTPPPHPLYASAPPIDRTRTNLRGPRGMPHLSAVPSHPRYQTHPSPKPKLTESRRPSEDRNEEQRVIGGSSHFPPGSPGSTRERSGAPNLEVQHSPRNTPTRETSSLQTPRPVTDSRSLLATPQRASSKPPHSSHSYSKPEQPKASGSGTSALGYVTNADSPGASSSKGRPVRDTPFEQRNNVGVRVLRRQGSMASYKARCRVARNDAAELLNCGV